MAKAEKHSHLTKRWNTWYARLTVPADVRHIIGRNIFIASTQQRDSKRANAVAAPWIAEWQRRIDDARAAAKNPLKAEIERLSNAYRQYRNKDLDPAGAALVMDVVDFLFERVGGVRPEAKWQVLTDARGDVAQAMQMLPDPANAAAVFDRISGQATPFLAHLDAWKAATHLQGKTLAQCLSDIKQFAMTVPEPIEKMSGRHVQRWIEGLMRPADGVSVSAKTVRRKLASLRGYWEYLQAHERVPAEQRPFADRKVNDGSTEMLDAEAARDRFAPADVVRLWQTAEARGDPMLAAAIRIAAYSGMRREGICTLRISSIRQDPDTGIEFLHVAEKTAAGVRDVPIHPAIRDLLSDLSKGADRDGYLIHSSDANKYRRRGDAIGKRFTRLKSGLGFDHRYTFHSLRHTVAHLLETAECPEGVAQDIVGHVKRGMTFGLYSGKTRLDHRARWLTRAVMYPTAPASSRPSKSTKQFG